MNGISLVGWQALADGLTAIPITADPTPSETLGQRQNRWLEEDIYTAQYLLAREATSY